MTIESTSAPTAPSSTIPSSPRSSPSARLIGFFPGLGSRAAFRDADPFADAGAPVRALFAEAAAALHDPRDADGIRFGAPMPTDRLRRQGHIGAAFLAHSLALERQLRERASSAGIAIGFDAFTGESFGILVAAVASGALSVRDGVRVAEAFTPLMLLASEHDAPPADQDDAFTAGLRRHLPRFAPGERPVREPAHVVALHGEPEHLAELLDHLGDAVPTADVEVHKRYSWRQVNVYVRAGYMDRFRLMSDRFPFVETAELKDPTTFLAHASRMHVVRDALASWMTHEGITFADPTVPVVANHRDALMLSGAEMRDAVLAMTDRTMDSEATVARIRTLDADMVLELGPGGKSLDLLAANGAETPSAPWTGTADDAGLLDAIALSERLRGTLRDLAATGAAPGTAEFDLLRTAFRTAAGSELHERWIRRVIGTTMDSVAGRPQRDDTIGIRRFLEVFGTTHAHRQHVDVTAGELVIRARVKKHLTGTPDVLGHARTELEVLAADGTVSVRDLDTPSHVESTVFHFEHQVDTGPEDLTRTVRRLVRAHPTAEQIHADLARAVATAAVTDVTEPGRASSPVGAVWRTAAVALVAHRVSLFELLRTHRPALLAQTDHHLAGSDRCGWLIALAISGAVAHADVVPLVARTLRDTGRSDQDDVRQDLATLSDRIGDASISVISPDGVPLSTRRELVDATRSVLVGGALDVPERRIQLNGVCLVISLGSTLPVYRVRAVPHRADVITVRSPAEIWHRGVNVALDDADERSALSRSLEHEHVLRYAQHRKILSSTVNAYLEPGETVVGFGAGGSESMTVFVERDDAPGRRVRKVLSDALSTVSWDPTGTGVMLPPFAKARKQAEYLQALPPRLGRVFPRVGTITSRELPVPAHVVADTDTFREVIYEMTYVPGEEVSRWVERARPPVQVVSRVYEAVIGVLHRDVHSVGRTPAPGDTLEEQYFRKIEDRLALCRRTAPDTFGPGLLDTGHVIVGGQRLRNIGPLLRTLRADPRYRAVLEPRVHSLVMGDTNTENVKLADTTPLRHAQELIERGAPEHEVDAALAAITADSIGVMFLDPRAIGFRSDGATTRDDPMYDNKPWHNSIGHYDEMHYEQFDLDVGTAEDGSPVVDVRFHDGNPYQVAYTGMEAHFASVMAAVHGADEHGVPVVPDDPYWLVRFVFTMGTHFTAMPPFHFLSEVDGTLVDSPLSQRRPIAIYVEGIKWLNWAVEMLEGTRTSFLGVPMPPLPNETADGASR
jgi:malonyl CoA-acyl carrier protein transacylase